MDALPPQTGRAALGVVRELLDDDPAKPGPVEPITRREPRSTLEPQ
ncbi:hypothetical protein [Pseudonocardia sp. HH130630-07]|nr:hypothetical protein [Pseudonocardia sp. HH130630-07]